jgi:probable F420-dependent oxidoreductase
MHPNGRLAPIPLPPDPLGRWLGPCGTIPAVTPLIAPGRLEVGMQLPVQSQSRIYAEAWEEGTGAAELGAVVDACEAAGLYYVAVCDHVAVPEEPAKRMQTIWYDTIATLSWIAGRTERLRLLSHVFVPAYRHPLVSAKAFLTLDELSGGRAIVGVGTGHVEGEFAALGADYANRGAVTDECIDVLRAAFTDEYPSYAGEHFQVEGVGLQPRPRQEVLPIWVGGSSKPALRRAATRGDGWLPQGTPRHELKDAIGYLLEHREAGPRAGQPLDLGTICEPVYVGEAGWDVGPWTISGAPEQLADKIREFKDLGVSHVQVRPRSRTLDELCDQLAALGRDVLPLLN